MIVRARLLAGILVLGALIAGSSRHAHALTQEACDPDGQPNGGCFGFELTFTWDDPQAHQPEDIAKSYYQWKSDLVAACNAPDNKGLPCWVEKHDKVGIRGEDLALGTPSQLCQSDAQRVKDAKELESLSMGARVCIRPSGKQAPWFYVVTRDGPAVEVNTRASNVTWLRMAQPVLAEVWGRAADLGLKPHAHIGGGHIHIDIESHFGATPVRYANLVTTLFAMWILPMSPSVTNIGAWAPPLPADFAKAHKAKIDGWKARRSS